jgi:hypothetical protein
MKKTKGAPLYRHRILLNGLAFDFTTSMQNAQYGLTLIGSPTDTEEQTYEVKFVSPLTENVVIAVTHVESKRTDTVFSVYPDSDDFQVQGDFTVFPTHVVGTQSLLFTLNNVQLRGDVPVPVWVPAFNLQWFVNREVGNRYIPLNFVHPLHTGSVDLSLVPQRMRITAKPSGGITSSRCPKLLGYYPGGGDGGAFTGWRAAAMRFGRLYEVVAVLMYLKRHPDYVFREVGFLSLEHGNDLDGAQPDGLVGQGGGVEIKCSKTNCLFEPSHVAQCIWELGCGLTYVDLVRFCEKQVKRDKLWVTEYECREVRIHRDPVLEKHVIGLCKRAHQVRDPKLFAELTQGDEYVNLRDHLATIAEEYNQRSEVIPVDVSVIDRLRAYKAQLLSTPPKVSPVGILDDIERRQARIFSLFQEEGREDELVDETAQQIRDYTEILRTRGKK